MGGICAGVWSLACNGRLINELMSILLCDAKYYTLCPTVSPVMTCATCPQIHFAAASTQDKLL
jgi:hypothetical protein